MGTFCTNITLLGADRAAVEAYLVEHGRAAFVGTWGAHTVVFDEQGEAQDGSHAALAAELSAVLGCVAVAALDHDSDILYLQLFESGEVRGEYNSAPGYFEDDPDAGPGPGGPEAWALGLDPASLVALVGRGDADRVAAITGTDAVFAEDVHAALLEELGLPLAACGFGFSYLSRGELPDDADAGNLRRVPVG